MAPFAPGPKALPLLGHLPWMLYDPFRFLTALSRKYGDVAAFRLGASPAVLINDPALINRLIRDRTCLRSDESRLGLRSFLGDGLLAIEGSHHLRHRRLMAPAFARERIRSYGALMCAETEAELARWQPGETRDLKEDMMRLTFAIVSNALFSANTRSEAREVGRALEIVLPWAMFGAVLAGVVPKLPVMYPPKARAAIAQLNQLVRGIVTRRRSEGGDRGDLLSMLLAARDEDGSALSDEDICAEALTLLLSGHDTTANTMSWAWHLLTENPDVQEALATEVRSLLGDRPVTIDDLPKLPLVDQVISETLRMFPAIWIGDRVPPQDIELGGYAIPARTRVLYCMYVTQRDGRYFADPERFDPSRFSPARIGSIPDGAFLPFGAGVHMCIGNNFALMEARVILASMVQRFAIASVAGHKVRKDPQIVLTMTSKFPVTIHTRKGRASETAQAGLSATAST